MQKLSAAALVPFEDRISSYYEKHQEHIRLFLFLLAVNVFFYGQRLVGFILAPDDVARMMVGAGGQASWNARWFNGFIGSTILGGERHILLFFNAAISVFSITLAGFITAFLFEAKRKTHIAIITLLCSTVPAWAANMYYSTNAIVFASTAWGVYGVYALYRHKTVGKIIGFILLVCAVGTYQSIIMVALAIVFVRTMMRCMRAERGKEMLRAALYMLAMISAIGLAYAASNAINAAAVSLMGIRIDVLGYMETQIPLTAADIGAAIVAVVSNATTTYSLLYERTYLLLLAALGVSAAASGIIAIKNYHNKLWAWKLIALLFFFVAMVLVKELLRVLGVYPPPQAQYAMGWIAAGLFFILVLHSDNTAISRFVRNVVFLAVAGIVIINVFVINVFFSLAQRGTQVDIIRANEMVASIRANKNYPGEETPLKVLFLGEPVRLEKRNYFSSTFAPWGGVQGVFRNYTDFNFVQADEQDFLEIKKLLKASGKKLKPYPDPEFIFMQENYVLLFLGYESADEAAKIQALGIEKPPEALIDGVRIGDINYAYKTKSTYPVIARAGGFEIFAAENMLCYFNAAVTPDEESDRIFLHVIPQNAGNFSSKSAQKRGFVNLADFSVAVTIKNTSNTTEIFSCYRLPSYPIAMIRTGQYASVSSMQKVRFILNEVSRRRKESGSIKEFASLLKQLAAEVKNSTLQYPWQRWIVTISGDDLSPL